MSKSLGNFFTVREISEKYDLQVLRFFMLSAHYRSPLNFSADLMEASKNGLERIRTAAEHQADCLKAAKEPASMTAEEEAESGSSRGVGCRSSRRRWTMISTPQMRFQLFLRL